LAARRLRRPDKSLSINKDIEIVSLPVPELLRISGFETGEPYFGKSGANRFDAPGCARGAAEYACCYLGLSFDVALAESLLHDAVPRRGKFGIAKSEIDRRWVHRFSAHLNLFDLTGHLLAKMGGHAALTGTSSHKIPQKWAKAVFDNPLKVDGFIYVSRHLPNEKAVIVFDRAKSKLVSTGPAIPLDQTPELVRAMTSFSITVT
jgi:hypothetical protein